MLKGIVLAIVAIFIAWSALDFIIHGMLLKETYEATAHLWRTIQDTNMMLMHAVTLAVAICFVLLYQRCVSEKSVAMGLKLGVLFGLAAGIMSASAYVYMPISLMLAIDWFIVTLVQFVIAGWLVGLFVKSEAL
jgi:hypothetical protein